MKKVLLFICIGGMLAFVACHREQQPTTTSPGAVSGQSVQLNN